MESDVQPKAEFRGQENALGQIPGETWEENFLRKLPTGKRLRTQSRRSL